MSAFDKGRALYEQLSALLTDYPVRFFLNTQVSHGALAFALNWRARNV